MQRQGVKKIVSCAVTGALALGTLWCLFAGPADRADVFAEGPFAGEAVILDAGHGGEDGGAVSPSGAEESGLNLAIVLRLDQMLGLYGVNTVLLRTEDVSLHDSDAETLREKKVSDLHNRVERIESIEGGTLISIHQNTYPAEKYHGAQVFYADEASSLPLAQRAQELLKEVLDPTNQRVAARISDSVYLMNHITCPAILVECGFLSNPEEERLLQDGGYQTKIAGALAGAYLQMRQEST